MKKIILLIAISFSLSYLKAQNADVISLMVAQKQYEKAKDEVDKWLANPKLKDKEKPTALLWKSYVYGMLYSDSATMSKYPTADGDALSAFSEYQQLDPTLKQMKESNMAGGISGVYNGYIQRGNEYWKAKTWDSAFKYFSQAERTGQVLISNKFTQSASGVDTTMILFTGVAAQNAKLTDSAANYYSRLADLKIGGADYESIYQYLVQYYSEKKDDANFKKYLAIGKELYPNDAIWSQFEMNNMTAGASVAELLQKYNAETGTMDENKLIGYAEALATNDKTQLESLDSTQKIAVKRAAADAFAKAFALNASNGLYAFNTGVIYYSIYGELDDRYSAYRGESAALKAKRAEITKEEAAYADTASEWLEKAYPVLKAKTDRSKPETASLNRTVDYLANIYYWKREQTKTNGQSKDFDKFDALYKKYDAEHNTYQ